jgi:hypothetical protein
MQNLKYSVLFFHSTLNDEGTKRRNKFDLTRRTVVFHFLAFQQKVKTLINSASSASRA